MERIVIPGRATYTPIALSDILVGTFGVQLLIGATVPGALLQASAFGYYAGASARDWVARWHVRPVDFRAEFDADVDRLEPMPPEARRLEIVRLAEALNRDYTPHRPAREEVARRVNRRLTEWIGAITDQEVVTSSEIRSFGLAKVMLPFAYGTCDVISGDVAIFQDTGIFEPHVVAHEFAHRKGYWKELHAQVVAYFALRTSGDPALVQAARAERLNRQLAVASDHDPVRYDALLRQAELRPELVASFQALRPAKAAAEGPVGRAMRALYDQRMKLTGQNGVSDYDAGFTNFLWTFARSDRARQDRAQAAV